MDVSRRHFLKASAAVGAAFLGLRHLAGCSATFHEELQRELGRPAPASEGGLTGR